MHDSAKQAQMPYETEQSNALVGSGAVSIDPNLNGTGNWREFYIPADVVIKEASKWRAPLQSAKKLWLCWNLEPEFCLLQQRLILEIGWTPVVGWDCRHQRSSPLLPGAIGVDFNSGFGFNLMFPHFPLEFVFCWAEKLAFWHSDLLVRMSTLRKIATLFESLQDGEIAAVPDHGGLRNILRFKRHRYFELIGCTTRAASQSQFDHGAGWWRNIWAHPQCPPQERDARKAHFYEHGVGIMYWKRKYGGLIKDVPLEPLIEGHFSETAGFLKSYRNTGNKLTELKQNFDFLTEVRRLDLEDFYVDATRGLTS